MSGIDPTRRPRETRLPSGEVNLAPATGSGERQAAAAPPARGTAPRPTSGGFRAALLADRVLGAGSASLPPAPPLDPAAVAAHLGDVFEDPADAVAAGRTSVRASVHVADPAFGGRPIDVRMPVGDVAFGPDGRPLPGPVGPRVRVVANPNTAAPVPLATASADGRFTVAPGDPRLAHLTAFATANRVHRLVERYAGQPLRWGDGGVLEVMPRAGATNALGLNAYFDPATQRLHFLYAVKRDLQAAAPVDAPDPLAEVLYDTALASEIVAHESGHAAFSALKPFTLLQFSDGDALVRHKSVHEGVADVIAILDGFRQPMTRNAALSETGGDLRRANRIAAIGEGLVSTPTQAVGMPVDPQRGSRNALGPGRFDRFHQNAMEPHAGGQPLAAGVYELIARRYDQGRASGNAGGAALRAADEVGELFFAGLQHYTDSGAGALPQVAEGMLAADILRNGGKREADLLAAFGPRSLLDASAVARVRARLAAVPPLDKPRDLAPGNLAAAERFLAQHRAALGWEPADLPLVPWRVERDKDGYTRVSFSQPLDNATWREMLQAGGLSPDGLGKLDPQAMRSFGSAYLLFGPDGKLRDAAADLRDPNPVMVDDLLSTPGTPMAPRTAEDILAMLCCQNPLHHHR